MSVSMRRRLLVGALGTAALLVALAPAGAASAGNRNHGSSVSVGNLVLQPTERGYRGTLPITITLRGTADVLPVVTVTEPVGGSFTSLLPEGPCFPLNDGPRRTVNCTIDRFEPGERRTVYAEFEVLTDARRYPMVATGGRVDVSVDSVPVRGGEAFSALFRSTTGSVLHPRPYVQDTVADGSVRVGPAVLNQQADGGYAGQVSVTVGYRSDAPHDELQVQLGLPEGVRTGEGVFCPFARCVVPGGEFMPGEVRTFDVPLTAEADIVAGPLGDATAQLHLPYGNAETPDSNPADNAATFTVTAVPAA